MTRIVATVGSNNPDEELIPKMFGAYIESISSSIAYGGQGGSCQISLVEDPENDVNITLPEVGTACFIKYGEFEYGGVFQRWTYKEDIGGKKYDVILESPGGKILNGVNVILSNFEGTMYNEGEGYDKFKPSSTNPNFTTQVKNVWNPYGHKENYSFGGRFGAANTNSAGFPARELLDLLELIGRNESDFGDRIKYGESEYEIDFGELKDVPEFFRISGQSASLNTVISECAEVLQYDYFAEVTTETPFSSLVKELYGEEYASGGGAIPNPLANGLRIKIKTIDKTQQPNPGAVAQLVEQAKADGTHVSSDVGQELSDEVTQRVVVGGPASRYWVANIDDCIPVWGKLGPKSYVLAPNFANTPAAYRADARVPIVLDEAGGLSPGGVSSFLTGTYNATVDELRMATFGFDSWSVFKVFESIANGTYQNDPWCADVDVDINTLREIATGARGPLSMASTSLTTAQKMYNEELKEYTQKLFSKVQNVANNFYGRMFLVPLPVEPGGIDNNLKFIEEDIREEHSWEYADSAWVSNKPISDIEFYDGTGRLKTVSVYQIDSSYDYGAMGGSYAGWKTFGQQQAFSDGIATTSASPQDNGAIFFLPGFSIYPFIVMDAGTQIKQFDSITTPDFGISYLAYKFFGINIPPENYIGPGKPNTQVAIPPNVVYPKYIGVPQTSNRYVWGPWYKSTTDNGRSDVVFDSSLVPESFGSVDRMNQAAQDAAGAGVAIVGASESGRVELAEIPKYNIAERFNASGPYVTNMDISISTSGLTTSYQFNTWTPNFGKLTKYNADRISRIYKASLDAINRIRQDNPKIPLKSKDFGKTKAEFLVARFAANRQNGGFTFMGSYSNPHVEGHVCSLSDAVGLANQRFLESFGCSEDQKWSPIGTRAVKTEDDSGFYFQLPIDPDEETDGKFAAGVCPSVKDLDPYFSEAVYGNANDMIRNTDFLAAVNASNGSSTDLQIRKANEVALTDEIRSAGLRGPLMLSGWGFDIANNPVPSLDDDITSFDTSVASNRRHWKTGPVNLMWDDERKIWSGGLEMVSGILKSDIESPDDPLSPTTFEVAILRRPVGFDGNNKIIKGEQSLEESEETITCYNRDTSLEQVANDNVFCILLRINYEWTPIWVGCP